MDTDQIYKCIQLADEFIKRGKKVLELQTNKNYKTVYGSLASGSIRRQSMELTRALAQLRK